MKNYSYDLNHISEAAKFLLEKLSEKILLFEGEMGSGKTTLIKELVKQLDSIDEANSPTFAIVNEYQSPNHKIYHFDLYRLKDFYEALDFGVEEYLSDPSAYVFIEWPGIIEDIIPENSKKIRIIVNENGTRELQLI